MQIQVPYGRSFQTAHIPDEISVDWVEAAPVAAAPNAQASVQAALENLLGDLDWNNYRTAKSVAIAINDKTRPVPHALLLPALLQRLHAAGISAAAITFYIAVGTHPPMQPAEFSSVLPPAILEKYRVISHDCENQATLIHLGTTTRGTPIYCQRAYYESDLKIVVGNIEPHQFAGFSGGVKTAAIGLAGLATINQNHALLAHPDSQLGSYSRNPARQDIEEIGAKIGVHLALNVILNQNREIVHALAGEPGAVMRAGVELSRQVCQVSVPAPYALVIASPGGHPKDINLYQAQKGLAHAVRITQPGGSVILLAACPEGSGSPHYEEWMRDMHTHSEVIARFQREGFRIGAHKAYQIARDASQVRLLLCSDMEPAFARALLLNPQPNLQTALDSALAQLPAGERIAILPHAAATIPTMET